MTGCDPELPKIHQHGTESKADTSLEDQLIGESVKAALFPKEHPGCLPASGDIGDIQHGLQQNNDKEINREGSEGPG